MNISIISIFVTSEQFKTGIADIEYDGIGLQIDT